MRAKFLITAVQPFNGGENITASAVGPTGNYGPNGETDDNDFFRWSPWGEFKMGFTNPEILGKMKAGEKYYLDFTLAE